MDRNSLVYVAGHRGLVGSAIVRKLQAGSFSNLLLRTRDQLDLTDQSAVTAFFEEGRPEYVFLAAAKVGGILANATYPADFIRDNILIQANVIDAAHRAGVRKLMNLGSSCTYPKHAPQPMQEDVLLTGPLEPTNEAYAIAKIAGLKMCQAYKHQWGFNAITVMPTNLYGPNDNFDLETSHVLAALIRKFHEAKEAGRHSVTVWGTGKPRREFLHVDDLADAVVFLMKTYEGEEPVNIGVGEDISIAELAALVGMIVGFEGEIVYDTSKPDGTPRKLLDVTRLHVLGWQARTPLDSGIRATYEWYRKSLAGRVP